MGCYDTINVFQECPICKKMSVIEAQTKDLNRMMYTYRPLSTTWNTGKLEKRFRKQLPVYPQFPGDKSAVVWKNQAEKIEAMATVLDECKKLRSVNVIADCNSCKNYFEGDIKIVRGRLVGEIHNIKILE